MFELTLPPPRDVQYFVHYNNLQKQFALFTLEIDVIFTNLNLLNLALNCEANSYDLFKSLSSPLPGTNKYWCHMRIL